MTQPLVVLALDIAKNRTGWAVGSTSWPRPHWGVFELSGEWERNQGKRLKAWRDFLARQIDNHHVTYLAMERLYVDLKAFDFNGTVPMAQMHGAAMLLAEDKGIRCGAVSIQSWRSHFLGTATAPKHLAASQRTKVWKDLAIKRAVERNWYCQLHDEAEALGIMDYALACLDPDYEHKTGPASRRAELKAEIAAFRGESPQ